MENCKRILFMIFIFLAGITQAQVNRYMVFFENKSGTPYSISNPSAFLSAKSIQRRINQGISIQESDLPINPAHEAAVANTGANVLYRTKWMNGVLVSCDASLVSTIASLPEVRLVEFVAPNAPANGGRLKSIKKRTNAHEESTANQLSMLGINTMHADGFNGESISIAIFDGGFLGVNSTDPFAHIFSENRYNALASYNFIQRNNNVFQYDDHGTRVLSIAGAFQENVFTGGAHKADFQLYVTEDIATEYRVEEYNWLFAAERSDSTGVDIINTSLGYSTFDLASMNYTPAQMDGNTAVVTRAAQFATGKGILVITSAGNEGNDVNWKIITAPGDGPDVLAIGNINGSGIRSSSSSIGPTSDNRIKPDVMALGSGTSVIRANGVVATGSGTSFSAPLVTSLAAGLWQRYPQLTNKELIEAIRMSASMSLAPDNFMGYGIPHYTAVKNYLEQIQQNELVAVIPNPVTNERLTIRPKDPELIRSLSFTLINLQGQVIEQRAVDFNWQNNQYTEDVSFLAAGIYFLRIVTAEQVLIFRIVKL